MDAIYNFKDIIPSNWKVKRLKSICSYISDGSHFSPELVDEGEKYVTVSNVYGDSIHLDEAGLISIDDYNQLIRTGCKPKKGDILLAKDGTVGRSAIVDDNNFVALSSLGIIRPSKVVTSKFLKYALDASILQEQMNAAMAGSALKRITIRKIQDLQTVVPPLDVQSHIVSYLDEKCAEIDNNILVLNQKKEKYGELKKSIIQQAVTKGLNPKEEMKKTDIIWATLVPDIWETCRLKDVAIVIAGQAPNGNDIYEEGVIPFMQGKAEFTDKYPQSIFFCDKCSKFSKQGDILMSVRAPIGDINMSDRTYGIGRGLAAIRAIKIYTPFLWYQLISAKDYINSLGSGSTFLAITASDISSLGILLPPHSEQIKIAQYLDKLVQQINDNCKTIDLQIEKFTSLKKSLINEVITGQRAV